MKHPSGKALDDGGHVQALTHALNCVPDFVVVTDLQGRICFANQACLTHFGYSWDELYERSPTVLFASQPGELAALFQRDWSGELRAVTKPGNSLAVAVDNAIIRNPAGEPLGVVSVFRDITRERLFEQQLLITQKMATVSSLTAGIAHEFNNLLTGIMGYAELLGAHVTEDMPGGNYLEQIKRAALEATDLTRQLSVFSQMAVIERRTCNLNDLLHEALGLVSPSAGSDVRFLSEIDSQRLTCDGDPSHLRQAFVNILLNACEAMPAGGLLRTALSECVLDAAQAAAVGLPGPGRFVQISVADQGPGMDEQLRRRVCEPFFSTKGAAHTGLGLTTAYGIFQKHGGGLQLESTPGQGTTVLVYLPVQAAAVEHATVPGPDSAASPTVLLVEDEEIPRQFARDVLEAAGYRVLAANDGEQGLKLFREHAPNINLVVTDILMPRLNGDAMVAEIRKLNQPVRVLAVSGYTRSDAADRLRSLGVNGFVQKPFTGQSFLDHVRQLLPTTPAE